MKKKSRKDLYLGNLIAQRQLMVIVAIFCCSLLFFSTKASQNLNYAKKNGEKVEGFVSDIRESRKSFT